MYYSTDYATKQMAHNPTKNTIGLNIDLQIIKYIYVC